MPTIYFCVSLRYKDPSTTDLQRYADELMQLQGVGVHDLGVHLALTPLALIGMLVCARDCVAASDLAVLDPHEVSASMGL